MNVCCLFFSRKDENRKINANASNERQRPRDRYQTIHSLLLKTMSQRQACSNDVVIKLCLQGDYYCARLKLSLRTDKSF